jgi:hypothetical protein
MNGQDNDAIREGLEKLRNSSMEIGKAIYAQGNQSQDSQSQEGEQQQQEGEKKDENKN